MKYDGNKLGTVSTFNLGVDAYDVATLGNISIGFVYKF
jgi:hypothetical protein